uniref:Uncharacterized protein n=1 Tax=Cacopsylla melanoneura TaxID=428564 RepID=A0A8D8TTN0_9HEMI
MKSENKNLFPERLAVFFPIFLLPSLSGDEGPKINDLKTLASDPNYYASSAFRSGAAYSPYSSGYSGSGSPYYGGNSDFLYQTRSGYQVPSYSSYSAYSY